MTVYAILAHDRHADPWVEVYGEKVNAIERAKVLAHEIARHPEDIKNGLTGDMGGYGWLYYASCSPEGDYVRVMVVELK